MTTTTTRTSCVACGHTALDLFLELGRSPIADAYLTHPGEHYEQYRLDVAVCERCRLVQLLEQVDAEILFGTGYSFYSSASPPLTVYHRRYAASVLCQFPDLAQSGIVEVGCNDGDLLQHFAAKGYPAVGVDPAAGPAAAAAARGLDVLVQQFGLATAHTLRDERGRAGIVIANHVLAHVEDVSDVLAGARALIRDDGVVIAEVQYLPDLLVNNAFDLIYHEHRQFFSLTSLAAAAARWHLYVADAELTDRQGGSLRVVLRPGLQPVTKQAAAILKAEDWLGDPAAYGGMQGRAERIRARLWRMIDEEVAARRVVALYGAPAKATTLLNWCGLTSDEVQWAVDTTPAKQGRFIPGTGIQILPPLPPDTLLDVGGRRSPSGADTYLLGAWNYAEEILRAHPGQRWIIPMPAPFRL